MKICSIIFAAAILATSAVHADIVIDTFDDGNTIVRTTVGTTTQGTTASSILGGQRDDSLTLVALGGDEFIGSMGFGGELTLSQGSLDQINGSLVYDNFANFDMTDGGINTAFAFDFVSSDAPATISDVLSVTAVSGGTSVTNFVSIPASGNLGVATVDFADFTGVDFTSLDEVSIDYNFATAPGRDFEIATFSAIPEPTSLAIIGLGGLGVLLRRRRK
ncbi:MAG: PEP-CTERM sorting domain-containing protein [Mariniblastus sp.]